MWMLDEVQITESDVWDVMKSFRHRGNRLKVWDYCPQKVFGEAV